MRPSLFATLLLASATLAHALPSDSADGPEPAKPSGAGKPAKPAGTGKPARPSGPGKPARPAPVELGAKGAASLLFFYFGDSYVTTLCQETTDLAEAMEGYKRSVLLRDKVKVGPFEVGKRENRQAEVVDTPSKANFFKHLRQLAKDGYFVDVFVFSHGWDAGFRSLEGGRHGEITAADVEAELAPAKTGLPTMPIRLVYQMNCYGSTMAPAWRKVGAKAVTGARYVNFFPNQYGRFMKHWNRGDALQVCLDEADTPASRGVVDTYLATIDAPKTKCTNRKERKGDCDFPGWDGCSFGTFVTGDKPCSKEYFTARWGIPFNSKHDGKWNTWYSSQKLLSGLNLTKSLKPDW